MEGMSGMKGMFSRKSSSASSDAKFLNRIRVDNTLPVSTNYVVDTAATFMVIHAIGPGGWYVNDVYNTTYPNFGGGAGAFAKAYRECIPGETLTLRACPGGISSPFGTSVFRGSARLIEAGAGNPATPSIPYAIGGVVTGAEEGDIAITGETATAPTIIGGVYSMVAAINNGDKNDADTLGCWGTPSTSSGLTFVLGSGFGTGCMRANNLSPARNLGGLLWIDFYTSDPRK